MLYKKNSVPALSKELFQNPTAEYRGTPFWSWNGKLEKDELCKQISQLKEMGFGGFHMHARTGLETKYLSDEFMELVKACCDQAEKEDMLAWLYDEDRWSSGPAGGIVTKHKPFRRKRLKLFTADQGWNTPKAAALEEGVPYLLAAYDVVLDSEGCLASYSRIEKDAPATGTKWYAYCVNEKEDAWFNYQTYFDALDKEAVGEFIRVTHGRYHQYIGERFGKSVPAIFTDEPNANHEKRMHPATPEYTGVQTYTWSRFFEEEYQKAYGQDILDVLPEMIWIKRDGSDSLIKYRYFDFIGELFSINFSKQIGDWCEEHGIAFTGHYLREPELETQAITSGDIMRQYGYQGLPGIDMLCGHRELTTAKQTVSAVHQYGKEGMVSELYGVTNWDFDFRGHKMEGDWQAAMGVTVRVPHLAWYTMKGEAKRDYPAAIGYQSPWYKEYGYMEDHFSRVNTALTRGNAIIKIGMIHPVESYWVSCGPVSQTTQQVNALEQNFKNVTSWLVSNHLDFDYICESTLPGLSREDAPRSVGKMTYDAIIVPGCVTLRASTLNYLENFRKNGGKVLFMGGCPTHIDGVKNDGCKALFDACQHVRFDSAALCSALEEERCVRILNSRGDIEDRVVYAYRKDNDCNWLFIACISEFVGGGSTSTHNVPQRDETVYNNFTITVSGEFVPTLYDTLTGETRPMTYVHKNGNTVISYPFIVCDSLLIRLANDSAAEFAEKKALTTVREYDIKGLVTYTLSEPNVLMLDRAEYRYDDGDWQEEEEVLRVSKNFRESLGYKSDQTQPYAIEIAPAEHTVDLRYTIHSDRALTGVQLAVEDADVVEIVFNGQKVENNITGFFTDASISTIPMPTIPAGDSVLELRFPYGERTNLEWCYLLGDFGVRVMGTYCLLTARQEKLGFGDICPQTLPFYGANVDYHMDVELAEDGTIEIEASCYRGALIGVSLDGQRVGRIVLPPYRLRIDGVKAGKHTLTLTLFGNRHNSFGALHKVNDGDLWYGPPAWRSTGAGWCYEYRTRPLGIMKSPIIRIYK